MSRQAATLTVDFNRDDRNMYMRFVNTYNFLFTICSYLVGTEDGSIHRCSCSYNEQFLDNYFGHGVRVVYICVKLDAISLLGACLPDPVVALRQQFVHELQC